MMHSAAELRSKFNRQLSLIECGKDLRSSILTRSKYESVVADLKRMRAEGKSRRVDYNRQRRFQLDDDADGRDLLIDPRKGLAYVVDDQLFDLFHDTHVRLGHVGRYAMIKYLRKRYVNINKKALFCYLSMCDQCSMTNNGGSGSSTTNVKVESGSTPPEGPLPPVPSPLSLPPADPVPQSPRSSLRSVTSPASITIGSRHRGAGPTTSLAIVNLIDFVRPGSDCRLIVIYQDKSSGFCMLRPAKAADEQVVHVLLEMLCTLGPPAVIRFHCNTKLDIKIIKGIRKFVPSVQVKCSKATGSRLPVGQLHLITSVQGKLDTWIQKNPGADWTEALKFVQLFVNTNFGRSTTKRRCEAMMQGVVSSSKRATKELVSQLLPESEVKKKRRTVKGRRPRSSSNMLTISKVVNEVVDRSAAIKVEPRSSSELEPSWKINRESEPRTHKRNLLDVIESLKLEKMRNADDAMIKRRH